MTLLGIIAFLITFSGTSFGEEDSTFTGWKKTLVFDINATQTAYSKSWAGGEAGSFSWVSNLNGSAEKQLSPVLNFRSTLKLSFGQTMTQDPDTKDWSRPEKSTDLIDWENVGRFTLKKAVDPYVAFRVETQFLDASVDAKKRYLNPLKLTESAGVAREFYKKDNDLVLSRIGFGLRQIINNEIVNDSTLETKRSTSTDGGIESVTDVKLTLHERLSYTGKLSLYKALFKSDDDELAGTEEEDYWKSVDVNWENIITASITKIIAVSFYTQFLYDKEIDKKGRIKETLGIGLTFTMF